ncbi:MAG: FAD-dependent oxidoreductase [Pseudomonadota bacterium]
MDDSDKCVDVLVAGSGAAGFAAALTARKAGLSVLMVEKEAVFGGTTAYSAGVVWIPMNHHARAAGIDDSREDALAYMADQAGNYFDLARAEAYVDTAHAMMRAFEDEGWAEFDLAPAWADYHPKAPGAVKGGRSLSPLEFDGRQLGDWFPKLRAPLKMMMGMGGMMIGRQDVPHVLAMARSARSALHVAGMMSRYFRDRLSGHGRGTRLMNGNALLAKMAVNAFEAGVELWLESPLVSLERDGRITGAAIERDGTRQRVAVSRGVVLASGGFPRAAERTGAAYAHLAAGKNHITLPPQGNTGDSAGMVEELGGRTTLDVAHPAAWTPVSRVPQADGTVEPDPHFIDRGKPGYIAVDRRGKRFASEAWSYHAFVPAMMAACEDDPEIAAWVICDHRALRRYGLGALGPAPCRVGPFVRSGYIKCGQTWSELAAACGVDAEGLEETVSRFNANASAGVDPEFERGSDAYQVFNGDPAHRPNPSLAPLLQPPFYAVRVEPGELGTFAGIATNASAQVLDVEGAAIPGLYAVGNDAASVMGGAYPGAGITIGPAMTFGYIAGRHLAKGVGEE